MLETVQQKITLGVFIFLLLSIPIGAYVASETKVFKSRASERPKVATESAQISLLDGEETKETSSLDALMQLTDALKEASATPTPTPVTADSFGPTLGFKLVLEGRPEGKMASKVFVGISEGFNSNGTPKYLLSFTIDLPDSGLFTNLSLAGLNPGSTYTAYIKPTVQIATSSSFIMSPTISYVNNNQPLTLLAGDLNQDNIINSADYSILKTLLGSSLTSANWNQDADFNVDGVINLLDLAYISKNMAKTGESGVWISTPATKSTELNINTPVGGQSGYWMWIPK